LGRFILDFYCSKLLLALEFDGSSHTNKAGLDFERDQYLPNLGIKTIRYTNEQVLTKLDDITSDLKEKIKTRETEISSLPPSFTKRGNEKGEIC
jgi:very-short-patch-repair endonuclease